MSEGFTVKTGISINEQTIYCAADRTKPIEALEKQIREVESKIKALIKEDQSLRHLFGLVTSVDGVGEVESLLLAIRLLD